MNVVDLYNPLSSGKLRRMNSDIFDCIEENANLLPSVPLRVIPLGVPGEDKEYVPDMVRLHDRLALHDGMRDRRANGLKMLYMTCAGLVFVLASLFFALKQEDSLLPELLSVIGSFALWEAADCAIIERKRVNGAMYETAQFLATGIALEP